MSFGRHACRHALKPPAASTLEHPWVSDDLLAAAFFRFANGQRRHGSCVPGPLEARRRLARRRNTALAGIGGSPAEDIACLFGRNGREHMKWTDHPWQRTHHEPQNLNSYSFQTAEASLPFYDHNPDPIDSRIPHEQTSPSMNENEPTQTYIFQKFLDGNGWGIEDARDFTRRLGLDLQREPEYSRQIFDKLLARSPTDVTEAIAFLNDPFLNTRGSGNYQAAVELFVRSKSMRNQRIAVLDSINRALELGLVPSNELRLIVETLPKIRIYKQKTLGTWDKPSLLKHYRAMWRAIGRCDILSYGELDKDIVDSWLRELQSIDEFRFAGIIICATHNAPSDTYWPSTFLLGWLEKMEGPDSPSSSHFPVALLSRLDADTAARCLINVTERLVLNRRTRENQNQQLEQWQHYLQGMKSAIAMSNASAIGCSQVWSDLPQAYMHNCQEAPSAFPSSCSLPVQHQIVLRLWILRCLSNSLGPIYASIPKATDQSIYLLLNMHEMTVSQTKGSFLADLLPSIHDLNMPYSGLLLLAVDLKLRRNITKFGRQILKDLETSQTSLADIWPNAAVYNAIRCVFGGTLEQMFRQLDLTDQQSIDQCLHLARVGDSESIWSILRLLERHSPIKISLHKAWVPIPCPDEMGLVRYHAGPRDSQCPDPHVAVDLINQLAITFSCCPQLSPKRAYYLVQWLYQYMRRHGGPIYPSMVRAMYHAGVVRYRRAGQRISPAQYDYIMFTVGKFEGRSVIRQLHEAPQIGLSSSSSRCD